MNKPQSDPIVACCFYSSVCTGPELETACEEATITALIQNNSLGREGLVKRKVLKREFHNVQFFRMPLHSPLYRIKEVIVTRFSVGVTEF